jgi:hypothetical protein
LNVDALSLVRNCSCGVQGFEIMSRLKRVGLVSGAVVAMLCGFAVPSRATPIAFDESSATTNLGGTVTPGFLMLCAVPDDSFTCALTNSDLIWFHNSGSTGAASFYSLAARG